MNEMVIILVMFSCPQVKENSRQNCFSEQIFYRKQLLGALQSFAWHNLVTFYKIGGTGLHSVGEGR